MKKSKKKIFLFSLLALLLIYVLWLSFHLLRFKTYKGYPRKDYSLEAEGVYHIHTLFSDGRRSVEEILKLAAQASLDFIILTDHGSPNYECLASQGRKEGVLVLAGSELSVSRGHLVGLGFKSLTHPFSQNAEQAVYEIGLSGGFSIIAHPYSKVSWSWGEFVDYSGIEIMNADTMLKKDILPSLPYLPALLVKPRFALIKMLDNPKKNLKKWDELNHQHPTYGYFSVDAHLLYRPLLSLFRLHLFLRRPLAADFESARNQVYEALREGRFYNAIDAAAIAKGFKFWGKQEEKMIPMGRTAELQVPLTLHIKAPFPFSKEIHLIRDGKIILRSEKESLLHPAQKPGIYRVEIYLRERSPLGENIPWIVSNPIFLRENKK